MKNHFPLLNRINVNPETGIRYGVVSLNSLAEWVFDEFFYHGENVTYRDAIEEFRSENPDASEDDVDAFMESYEGYEDCYELESDGMKLALSYLGGTPIVWVFESPIVDRARLCSPCVPNAGDLDNRDPNGYDCYSLRQDWFDRSY